MLFFLLVVLPFADYAQSLEVKKETARIDGGTAVGYQVAISGTDEEVRGSLTKYLKGFGKTKQSGDYITIADLQMEGKKYPYTVYATTRVNGNTTSAWIGTPEESGEESGGRRDLEKLVYDFGVIFQREKIQLQIDESLRALQAVEKQQTRLTNQNKDLLSRIDYNKKEKIQLEKSLADNSAELEDLTRKVEANKKAQDSVAIATGQIRKVVELHKERQRLVH